MPEQAMESALSQLANSELADKLPSVASDPTINEGFQILDTEDNDTRAVGVFSLNVNGVRMIIPVFYLNSQLRGMDLLYIVNQDLFVPAKEGWIDFFLSSKAETLGTPGKGLSSPVPFSTPDFSNVGTAPIKRAFEIPDVDLAVPALLREHPGFGNMLLRSMAKSAALTNLVESAYGLETDADYEKFFNPAAIAKAAAVTDVSTDNVEVILSPDDTGAANLSDSEKERLLAGDAVVVDKRKDEEKADLYYIDTEREITSPTEAGQYEVYVQDGTVRDVFIAQPNIAFDKNSDINRQLPRMVVCDPKNAESCAAERNDILVTGGISKDSWILDQAKTVNTVKRGYRYVMVANGTVSAPFKMLMRFPEDDRISLRVKSLDCKATEWKCDHDDRTIGNSGKPLHYSEDWRPIFDEWEWRESVRLLVSKNSDEQTKRVTETAPGTYVIPSDAKFIELGSDWNETTVGEERRATELMLADIKKIDTLEKSKAELESLDAFKDGTGRITIRTDKQASIFSETQALKHLVCSLGLGEEISRHVIKTAKTNQLTRYLYKRAGDFPAVVDKLPGYDGTYNAMVTSPDTQTVTAYGDPEPEDKSLTQLLDERTYDPSQAGKAMETSEDSVMADASILTGLLRANDAVDLIKQYIPDMLRGLDRIGRTLFLFYWHYSDFVDAYGRNEAVELEDSLRSIFESLGEQILFLKQKTVVADPERAAMEIELT